jgi:hypothetical protein
LKLKILLSTVFLCIVLLSHGQWIYSNLSEPKMQMGSTALGNKAYFAGGNDGTDALDVVEIYDIDTEEWDSIIHLSQARFFPSCVAAGSKVFFAGGIDLYSIACYDNVDIWNTVTKEWTPELLSVARFGSGAVSKGNKVLFAGGADLAAGVSYDIVDIYDMTTFSWSEAHLSAPRAAMASAVVGDLAFFAGGVDVQTGLVSNKVDIYRFSTGTWSTAALTEARAFLAATATGSRILIAGGTNADNNPSDRVDIYDTITSKWTTATLSEARSLHQNNAATVCGNAYFVGGGLIDLNTYSWTSSSSTIDIYNWNDSTWTIDNLTQGINNHNVAGVKDHLVVAGGKTSTSPVSSVETYIDPDCIWPVGINNSSKVEEIRFKVYPNPSSGNFQLEMLYDNHQKSLLVTIYNLQGQVVYNQMLQPGDLVLNINVPDGLYLSKIISDNATHTELIAIQN